MIPVFRMINTTEIVTNLRYV